MDVRPPPAAPRRQQYFGLSRRHFLAASASLPVAFATAAHSAPTTQPANLIVERRVIDVHGRSASVFGIVQQNGTPGLVLEPGQRFTAAVTNGCGEATIVHWHGQSPPFLQDGVAETGGVIIEPGTAQTYDFAASPGTHWMHSHHGLQEQSLLAAPLIIRTAEDMRADVQEVIVLLHDFTFQDPAEVLASITNPARAAAAMPGMSMAQTGASPTPSGVGQDLNDADYDAYLANERTLTDPLVVRAEAGGRIRLRLINGATSTAFWIDTGDLDGTMIAADGNPIIALIGRRFPIAQGQRLDILVDLPKGGGAFPILAQREGGRQRTGVILATMGAVVPKLSEMAETEATPIDLLLEQRLVALTPLPLSDVGITHRVALTGSMSPYVWSIDDHTWVSHRPLRVTKGQRVVLEMTNRSRMAHPMHLHGHHFQVIAIDGASRAGAMRDTVLVPANGMVTVAFDADNPGRWLFHCHNLFHMASGMMTEVVYDDVA